MNHTTLTRSLRIIIVSILIIQHTDDLLERMKKNKIIIIITVEDKKFGSIIQLCNRYQKAYTTCTSSFYNHL